MPLAASKRSQTFNRAECSVLAMGEMVIGMACTIGPLIGGAMFADAGPCLSILLS